VATGAHAALRHVWVEPVVLLTSPRVELRDSKGYDREHSVRLGDAARFFTDATRFENRSPQPASTLPHVGEILTVSESAGCVPFWGVDRFDFRFKEGACAEFATSALQSAMDSETTKVVVLASMGPVYITGEAFRGFDEARVTDDGLVLVNSAEIRDRWKVFELGLRDTLRRLELADKRVVVVIDVPELGIAPQNCDLSRPVSCQNPRAEIDRRTARYRELVRTVSSEFSHVTVFDPTELFCNQSVCIGSSNSRALYADVDHLSEFGSQFVGDKLGPLLLRLTTSP
jgi:hypothetical protein